MKTKYQPGDRVRVRKDLQTDACYKMEDGNRNSFVSAMEYFKGMVVTIKEITLGQYEIEEDDDGYGWTDEMFEPVELKIKKGDTIKCTKPLNFFTVGKTYKAISSNTVRDDDDDTHTLSIDSLSKYFELVPKVEVPKTTQFKVGDWVYHSGNKYTYKITEIMKDGSCFKAEFGYGHDSGYLALCLCTPATYEQINQAFLEEAKRRYPIGTKFYPAHVGIREVFEVVSHELARPEEFPNCISFKSKTTSKIPWVPNVYYKGKWAEIVKPVEKWSVGSYVVFLNKFWSSIEIGEIDKIEKKVNEYNCIILNKHNPCSINREREGEIKWFATKKEAEAFAETLKPIITAESEAEKLGLAVGDVVMVDSNTSNPIGFRSKGGRTNQLFGWVGARTIASFHLFEGKLYIMMEDINRGYILAEMCSKVVESKIFKLGQYDVTISRDYVKIGCTELTKINVVEFLNTFLEFSIIIGRDSDTIVMNGITITRAIAQDLLNYIDKH